MKWQETKKKERTTTTTTTTTTTYAKEGVDKTQPNPLNDNKSEKNSKTSFRSKENTCILTIPSRKKRRL
jgi:hypothetical protein